MPPTPFPPTACFSPARRGRRIRPCVEVESAQLGPDGGRQVGGEVWVGWKAGCGEGRGGCQEEMKVQRTLRWRDTKVQRIVKEGVSHGVEGTGSSGEGKLREGERSGGGRGGALPLGRHQDDSQLCQRPPESVDDAPSSLLLLDGAWRSGRPRPSSLPPPLFLPRLGPRMGRDGGAFELIRLPLPDLSACGEAGHTQKWGSVT